ncbi:MAG: rRNA maturation RNase YbeY [Isosphaeraceae bacterium]
MSTSPANDCDLPNHASQSAVVVEIGDTQGFLQVDHDRLRRLARQVLLGEGVRRASISLALVDDQTIHRINRDHLGHDWPTDVISFPLSPPGDAELAGELVVSAEMARDATLSIGAEPADELALYVVHGLLHLCGYNDGNEEETRLMRQREDLVLRREGFANTYSLVERATRPAGQEQWACSG